MGLDGMDGQLLTLIIENKCEKGIAFIFCLMLHKCVMKCA